ncbi:MAG: hypothetical protein J6S23_03520 [Clostridia bacterium]|nr:hypothetical protein [Clostridia bacterium]
MTTKEFKLSYKHFLETVTKHTHNSANKYVSYINKACSLPGMSDFWDRLASCDDAIIQTKYVEELCDAITDALADTECDIKRKDLRDMQSSAHVLLAFVSGQTWVKHIGICVKFTAIYNHRTLRSKFLSRLTTQDRIYDFGTFPINIINGIANRKKISLFDKMIDEIKVIYNAKGEYFYFKDVSRIMLATDGYAYFEKEGNVYTVFTEVPGKGPAKYVKLHAPKIDELSLDHDNPIEKELKKCISLMPTLEALSTDILDFRKTYKTIHKKLDNRTVLRNYKDKMITIDEDELIKEITEFLSKLSLTIMERSLNSSKGSKTVTP